MEERTAHRACRRLRGERQQGYKRELLIAEQHEEEVRHSLRHLQAAEFLYETRLLPEIEYTFKHALTQQVAYENLPQERRRHLHARIVAALETLYAGRRGERGNGWPTTRSGRGLRIKRSATTGRRAPSHTWLVVLLAELGVLPRGFP